MEHVGSAFHDLTDTLAYTDFFTSFTGTKSKNTKLTLLAYISLTPFTEHGNDAAKCVCALQFNDSVKKNPPKTPWFLRLWQITMERWLSYGCFESAHYSNTLFFTDTHSLSGSLHGPTGTLICAPSWQQKQAQDHSISQAAGSLVSERNTQEGVTESFIIWHSQSFNQSVSHWYNMTQNKKYTYIFI